MNRIFAKYFRGFQYVEVELSGTNILVGDNSSGKSSFLHLIYAILRDDLSGVPRLNTDLGVGEYDYFSPYFDFEDVIFGFETSGESGKIQKVISVRRNKGSIPQVVRCSYLIRGKLVSFMRRGDEILYRMKNSLDDSIEKTLEIHDSDDDFKVVDKNYPKGIDLSDRGAFFYLLSPNSLDVKEDPEFSGALGEFFSIILPTCSFVGPIRSLPAKYYEQMRKTSPLGLHFASMISDMPERTKAKHMSVINKFGRASGLFDKVRVEPISDKVDEAPLLVLVERSGKQFLLNQVGVGVSQVAPVLVETVFATSSGRRVALLQQPELHLHPVAQAELGSFMHSQAQEGLCCFVETHSNYLIDRWRADYSSSKKKKTYQLKVHFFEGGKSGNNISCCVVNRGGEIDNAPTSYFDFFLSESLRTMI